MTHMLPSRSAAGDHEYRLNRVKGSVYPEEQALLPQPIWKLIESYSELHQLHAVGVVSPFEDATTLFKHFIGLSQMVSHLYLVNTALDSSTPSAICDQTYIRNKHAVSASDVRFLYTKAGFDAEDVTERRSIWKSPRVAWKEALALLGTKRVFFVAIAPWNFISTPADHIERLLSDVCLRRGTTCTSVHIDEFNNKACLTAEVQRKATKVMVFVDPQT